MTPVDELELEPAEPAALVPLTSLAEVLGPDVELPALIKFVPDVRLKAAADQATAYALGVSVHGPEGLQRADVALTALRGSVAAITENFKDATELANTVHKRLTGLRGQWTEAATAAVKAVGARIFNEQQRLQRIADDERRAAQEKADRQAKEQARREADAARKANAPAPVVEEMARRVETATAAPVTTAAAVPKLQGSSTVVTWKARPKGTPADADPNPKMADLSPAQIERVHELLRDILTKQAPITAIELNWSVLNNRAKSDKATFAIAGFEAFQDGGVRAKGSRS